MTQIEGLNVNGDIVAELKDKTFFVASEPYYVELPDLRNVGKTIRKLKVAVKISDGSNMDYYPNKASIKMMTVQYGFDTKLWVGHKFEWGVVDQNVAGTIRKILFVLAKKFTDYLPEGN